MCGGETGSAVPASAAGRREPRGMAGSGGPRTVLGHRLRPGAIAAVAARVADSGANIDRITRLSRYPVTSIELDLSGADDADRLRQALVADAAAGGFDIAVQPAGLHRRAKRLV